MPSEIVTADVPRPIRRRPGSNITIINQLSVDVFFDNDIGRLAAAAPGAVSTANGTKIANSGGQVQFSSWAGTGVVYFRSNSPTQIEVQP